MGKTLIEGLAEAVSAVKTKKLGAVSAKKNVVGTAKGTRKVADQGPIGKPGNHAQDAQAKRPSTYNK